MKTICVQAGNSDDKLTQNEWSHFVLGIKEIMEITCRRIHFSGGSDPEAPWQNFCWIGELVSDDALPVCIERLQQIRKTFRQDSVAVIVGDTVYLITTTPRSGERVIFHGDQVNGKVDF